MQSQDDGADVDRWKNYIDKQSSGLSPAEESHTNGQALTGTNMMLVGKLQGGYCADWLTIAANHANGKYMDENVKWLNGEKPSITYLLGCSMKETDLDSIELDGQKVKVPKSPLGLKVAKYGTTVGGSPFTLQNVNTDWFLKNGINYRHDYFNENFKHNYSTGFQIDRGFFSRSYGDPVNNLGNRYASLMNGYSIPEDKVRGKPESDISYFPDWVSIAIQSGWSRLAENKTVTGSASYNMDSPNIDGVAYMMHNAGQGNFPSWLGFAHKNTADGAGGFTSEAIADIPNLSSGGSVFAGSCTLDAVNQLVAAADKCYNYILANFSSMEEGDFVNRAFFEGLAAGGVCFSCKDVFVTPNAAGRFPAKLSGKAYSRGVNWAYAAIKGGSPTSDAGVTAFREMLSNPKQPAGYTLYPGKGTTDGTLYFYDASGHTIDGLKPVIHAAIEEPVSGLFWTAIGGAYLYWKMLLYSGVECTFQDALADTINGTVLVEEAEKSAPGAAGYAQNSSLADAIVSMSYPTRQEGKADFKEKWEQSKRRRTSKGGMHPEGIVCGTPLYITIHQGVLSGDPYYASCDRGVCTAVRWAGHDDNFNRGGCYEITKYLVSSTKWKELDWTGKQEELKPGDILVRSDTWMSAHRGTPNNNVGHIVMYVGKEAVLKRYPKGAESDACVCAASYGSRPLCCQIWEGGQSRPFSSYMAFRSVYVEPQSRYVGLTANSIT